MELSELQPEMQSATLMGPESNKRAPSGFQGVRGKKWTGTFFMLETHLPKSNTTNFLFLFTCCNM